MNNFMLAAMVDEFTKIAENPELFAMSKIPAAARALAKPVKDVSRGAMSLGDHIKAGPIPGGLRSFSGKLPPPLPKTAGFLGDLATKAKNVAMTDMGGPKGVLQTAAQAASNGGPTKGGPSKGFQQFQQKFRSAQG